MKNLFIATLILIIGLTSWFLLLGKYNAGEIAILSTSITIILSFIIGLIFKEKLTIYK